jgi:hypothetical protein
MKAWKGKSPISNKRQVKITPSYSVILKNALKLVKNVTLNLVGKTA